MSATSLAPGVIRNSAADAALRAALRLWFLAAVTGQWVFAIYVSAFYGGAASRGEWLTWNKVLTHGYEAGNTIGNATVAAHLLFAAIITISGPLQLVSAVRERFPAFHRWNGRSYLLAASVMGVSGLYLALSGRKVAGNGSVSITINAILILVFAVAAAHFAIARDFKTHRRWAIRLFLVVSGVWFFRVGLMFWLIVNGGPAGFNAHAFKGPFLTFMGFAQYLVPLTVFESYLLTQRSAGARGRIAMTAGLLALTAMMAVGIFGAISGMWLPVLRGGDSSV